MSHKHIGLCLPGGCLEPCFGVSEQGAPWWDRVGAAFGMYALGVQGSVQHRVSGYAVGV